MTVSTDLNGLKNVINLDAYEPQQVAWKYWRVGSDNNSRLSVPGPSDYALQAALYFDNQTIERIKNDYLLLSVNLMNLNKDAYKFDWLTKDKIEQVESYDSFDYDPYFFQKGGLKNGGFIILDEQIILLYVFTTR